MDPLSADKAFYVSVKYAKVQDHFEVNNVTSTATSLPPLLTAAHGSSFYSTAPQGNTVRPHCSTADHRCHTSMFGNLIRCRDVT